MEITELSSHSTQLTQQSSVASENGGTVTESPPDVTGELMPLILGQLQSITASVVGGGVGGGGGGDDDWAGACASSACHSLKSHNSPYCSNSSRKSFGNNSNKSAISTNPAVAAVAVATTAFPSASSTATYSASASSVGEESARNSSVVGSASAGELGELGEIQREEESSTATTGTSSEECLFDSSSSSSSVDSQLTSQYDDVAAEFSCFLEGLRNSLKRSARNDSNSNCALADSFSVSPQHPSPPVPSGQGGLRSVTTCAPLLAPRYSYQQQPPAAALTGPVLIGSGSLRPGITCAKAADSAGASGDDPGLIQQVNKVLTLLRASLVHDPGGAVQVPGNPDLSASTDPSKASELIALIDRLQSSLATAEERRHEDKERSPADNPPSSRVGSNPCHTSAADCGESPSMLAGCAQSRPCVSTPFSMTRSSSSHCSPWTADFSSSSNEQLTGSHLTTTKPTDLARLSDNSDVIERIVLACNDGGGGGGGGGGSGETHGKEESGEGVPWKIRLGRRRSQTRSHTVGVTQEELAQARRLFEETTAFRLEARDQRKQQQWVYSNLHDLSSSGNFESVSTGYSNGGRISGNNNNSSSNDGASNNLMSSINNYIQSDASVVGTVPTYSTGAAVSSAASENEHLVEDNLPDSPICVVPFPRKEPVPSIGGGYVSAPNWQTDVEKRLTSMPRPFVPFVKHATQFYEGYQPPPERRMTYASIDDSCPMTGGVIGNLKIKPFRTYSLENSKSSSYDDPSKSLFTPQETVQIAIHQAAIKKQMSEEEDRRKRRNSLSSYQLPGMSDVKPERDFTLGMPKPYSPPKHNHATERQQSQQQVEPQSPCEVQHNSKLSSLFQSADSGYTEESGTESHQKEDQPTVCYENLPVAKPLLPTTVVPPAAGKSAIFMDACEGFAAVITCKNLARFRL